MDSIMIYYYELNEATYYDYYHCQLRNEISTKEDRRVERHLVGAKEEGKRRLKKGSLSFGRGCHWWSS